MADTSTNSSDGARRASSGGSARKALQLLFTFSERRPSATVPELARVVGLPIATAYRHVALLRDLQLIEEGAVGSYHPTPRVMALARAAQLSNRLADLARPVIAEVSARFGETVMLMERYGDVVVCAELTECDRPMRFTFQRGHTLPLGVGASGKMALASLPVQERDVWTREAEIEGLDADVARIAEQGFAVSAGEIDDGVWACSVPVIGSSTHPLVLTVAGPRSRIDDAVRAEAAEVLTRAADRIRDLAGLADSEFSAHPSAGSSPTR